MATELLDGAVAALPRRLVRPLLAIAVAASGWLAWENYRPQVMLAPLQAQVSGTNQRVTVLSERLDSVQTLLATRLERWDAMQRWMCFQNRLDAVKAGIPCKSLMEE